MLIPKPAVNYSLIISMVLLFMILLVALTFSARLEDYELKGDSGGKVMVLDKSTNEVVKTFSMTPGVVVRETGWLDDGKIVYASQKDQAVLWDFETGREIKRFSQRIYLFSHDEKRFVTFSSTPKNHLEVYSYPSMKHEFNLEGVEGMGPCALMFSPNDRFLLVQFHNYYPLTDELYPSPELRKSLYGMRLYDMKTGQWVEEFNRGIPRISMMGEFSDDSKYYYARDIGPGNEPVISYSQRFDLKSLTWTGN